MGAVTIERGSVLIYRVFDIAEEIDLAAIEELLKDRSIMTRLRMARSTRQAFHIRNAPLLLALGQTSVRIGAQTVDVETFAKVWDYGILSLQFQLPIPPGTPWEELTRQAAAAEDDSEIDEAARKHARSLTQTLASAMLQAHEWHGIEDYTIFFFEKLGGIERPVDLLQKADVPALILADPTTKLAARVRTGILDTLLQYGESDLAIIDWNAAVVVEPSGQRDVAEVLEFAVTHLMEFRYYDDLLDQRLGVLYDNIEAGRGGMLRNRFGRLSHEASTRFIEFSEFIERVENSLKVVGDFYLATVFRTAAHRFRLKDWEESVTRKMNLLARVTELLQGEVNVQRSHWLEIIIIALIAFEILSALIQL